MLSTFLRRSARILALCAFLLLAVPLAIGEYAVTPGTGPDPWKVSVIDSGTFSTIDAAIQNAVNRGGTRVALPPGLHQMSASVSVSRDGVTIYGGPDTKLLNASSGTVGYFSFTGDHATLRDVYFVVNAAVNDQRAVKFASCLAPTVEGVTWEVTTASGSDSNPMVMLEFEETVASTCRNTRVYPNIGVTGWQYDRGTSASFNSNYYGTKTDGGISEVSVVRRPGYRGLDILGCEQSNWGGGCIFKGCGDAETGYPMDRAISYVSTITTDVAPREGHSEIHDFTAELCDAYNYVWIQGGYFMHIYSMDLGNNRAPHLNNGVNTFDGAIVFRPNGQKVNPAAFVQNCEIHEVQESIHVALTDGAFDLETLTLSETGAFADYDGFPKRRIQITNGSGQILVSAGAFDDDDGSHTNVITKNGAFAAYTWKATDDFQVISVVTGTAVSAMVPVLGKIDDDSIYLASAVTTEGTDDTVTGYLHTGVAAGVYTMASRTSDDAVVLVDQEGLCGDVASGLTSAESFPAEIYLDGVTRSKISENHIDAGFFGAGIRVNVSTCTHIQITNNEFLSPYTSEVVLPAYDPLQYAIKFVRIGSAVNTFLGCQVANNMDRGPTYMLWPDIAGAADTATANTLTTGMPNGISGPIMWTGMSFDKSREIVSSAIAFQKIATAAGDYPRLDAPASDLFTGLQVGDMFELSGAAANLNNGFHIIVAIDDASGDGTVDWVDLAKTGSFLDFAADVAAGTEYTLKFHPRTSTNISFAPLSG